MRRLLLLFFVIAIVTGIVYYYRLERKREISNQLILYGNVDIRQVDLGFRVAGRVIEMPWQEGNLVPKGSFMGRLDKQPYEDQFRQAIAAVEANKVQVAYNEQLFKRRQQLQGSGGISQEDLENTRTNFNVSQANLRQSEASLGVAQTNLRETEVFAPNDGIILTRIREPGAVVRESDPIYTLSLMDPIWVRAFVAEPNLGHVYPGMPADIFTDSSPNIYKGTVGFISPVAEFTPKTVETAQLRTDLVYRLRIYIQNPDKGLRQGMPVTVKLSVNPLPPENREPNNQETK